MYFKILFSKFKLVFLAMLQDGMIFRPHRKNVEAPKEPNEYGLFEAGEYILKLENNHKLHYWYKPAAEGKKTFIFFHGNTGHYGDVGTPEKNEVFDRRYRINLLKEIAKRGEGFLAFSLSGYGKSTGTPSQAQFEKDIADITNFIKKEGYKNISIIGESLGSWLALHTANSLSQMGVRVDEVAIISSFYSLYEKIYDLHPDFRFINIDKKVKHRFDNADEISKLSKNTKLYIFHAQDDKTTHISHSQSLFEHAKSEGVDASFCALEDCGHISWRADEIMEIIDSQNSKV